MHFVTGSALDCRTGQNKDRYDKQELSFPLVLLTGTICTKNQQDSIKIMLEGLHQKIDGSDVKNLAVCRALFQVIPKFQVDV